MKINTNYFAFLFPCVFITLPCCKKTEPSPTSYTKNLAGNHKWIGTVLKFNSNTPFDTTFEATITILNDNAVRFEDSLVSPTQILLYIDKKYRFNENIYVYFNLSIVGTKVTVRTDTLKYNYKNNTINFYSKNEIGWNSRIVDVHTP